MIGKREIIYIFHQLFGELPIAGAGKISHTLSGEIAYGSDNIRIPRRFGLLRQNRHASEIITFGEIDFFLAFLGDGHGTAHHIGFACNQGFDQPSEIHRNEFELHIQFIGDPPHDLNIEPDILSVRPGITHRLQHRFGGKAQCTVPAGEILPVRPAAERFLRGIGAAPFRGHGIQLPGTFQLTDHGARLGRQRRTLAESKAVGILRVNAGNLQLVRELCGKEPCHRLVQQNRIGFAGTQRLNRRIIIVERQIFDIVHQRLGQLRKNRAVQICRAFAGKILDRGNDIARLGRAG